MTSPQRIKLSQFNLNKHWNLLLTSVQISTSEMISFYKKQLTNERL